MAVVDLGLPIHLQCRVLIFLNLSTGAYGSVRYSRLLIVLVTPIGYWYAPGKPFKLSTIGMLLVNHSNCLLLVCSW